MKRLNQSPRERIDKKAQIAMLTVTMLTVTMLLYSRDCIPFDAQR